MLVLEYNSIKAAEGADALSLSRSVALLTAGRDRPYALGLAGALLDQGIAFEFIASDGLDSPLLHSNPLVTFRNLRGDQGSDVALIEKCVRVLRYYTRLIVYAARAKPRIFHILWNNKFEVFDRTVLMLLYRVFGRQVVLTAHNVNIGVRDGRDSLLNRWTLRMQYGMARHIFVHTKQMRESLQTEFAVPGRKISVIPFGLNSTLPETALDRGSARARIGLGEHEKVLLFFGNIASYKGVEYLIRAISILSRDGLTCRLVIAGRVKGTARYWEELDAEIEELGLRNLIVTRIEFIPDDQAEVYFKAADVVVLPYRYIFQSGVLFLAYNFGLPVIASDVGALREDVLVGKTGFLCRPEDPVSLAQSIRCYFESDLYRKLEVQKGEIRAFASRRYSWMKVGESTRTIYL